MTTVQEGTWVKPREADLMVAAAAMRQSSLRATWQARNAARRIVAQVLWDATGHPTDDRMRGIAAAELAERMNDGLVPATALPSTLWKAVTA